MLFESKALPRVDPSRVAPLASGVLRRCGPNCAWRRLPSWPFARSWVRPAAPGRRPHPSLRVAMPLESKALPRVDPPRVAPLSFETPGVVGPGAHGAAIPGNGTQYAPAHF